MSRKKWLLFLAAALCLVGCIDLLPWAVVHYPYMEGYSPADASPYRLHIVGEALRRYYEDHGRLPPATVTDKNGRPLYSWRVLLLPYLDLEMAQQFRLDEPWDSPHNKRLLEKTFWEYRCWAARDGPGMTRYKVFVGPGTAFDGGSVKWEDLAETILVVEAGEPVPWSKPADLSYDPASPLPPMDSVFKRPAFFLGFYLGQEQCFLALFGAGKVCFLCNDTDERPLRGFISRNGGEKAKEAKTE